MSDDVYLSARCARGLTVRDRYQDRDPRYRDREWGVLQSVRDETEILHILPEKSDKSDDNEDVILWVHQAICCIEVDSSWKAPQLRLTVEKPSQKHWRIYTARQ